MQKRNVKSVNKSKRQIAIFLLFAGGLLSLSACSTIGYYGQSVVGHSQLMLAREPIEDLIQSVEPELKARLLKVQKIRQFAVEALALPDNSSYSTYVDLDRDYPVWTVVAAEEFSVSPKSWCYPVIGCASYRGYFSKQAALNYAADLHAEGLETSVGGATAYSTLGWFSDPLLPSMMRHSDADMAETLFHELAHQVLYVNGNSAFNEAFASVVGEQGTLMWLQQHQPQSLVAYTNSLQINDDFTELLLSTKDKLASLYSQDLPEQQKRSKKENLIVMLNEEYQSLKNTKWGGEGIYDRWFEIPVNNARLAAISTYRDEMPSLHSLLERCGYEFELFFETLKQVVKKYPSELLLENLPQDCSPQA